ncbi:hypothetical protein [Brevibacillus parabrevis]|nr:hypothetical protein [Brevibacillus parabrevis]
MDLKASLTILENPNGQWVKELEDAKLKERMQMEAIEISKLR